MILFTNLLCNMGLLNSLNRSQLKQMNMTKKIPQNLMVGILSQCPQICFISWHFCMLQRMILGIICAIKTFLSDYLEQFNSNITNQ